MSELMQYFIGFAAFAALSGITINNTKDKKALTALIFGLVSSVIWFGWALYCLIMCALIIYNEAP